MTNLDPDERHEVHNARILELKSGDISSKEFIASLVDQVGLTEAEARSQWVELKLQNEIAIYNHAKCRCMVEYPIDGRWQRGMITAIYADAGAIVQTAERFDALRVPFSLFELRLAK